MSTILDFILGIFTFQGSAIVSVVFYLALLVVPGLTFMAAKSKSPSSTRILGLAMKGIAYSIFIGGIVILALIVTSRNDLTLGGSGEDGEATSSDLDITAVLVQPKDGWIFLEDGLFLKNQQLDDQATWQPYLESHKDAKVIDGALYDAMDADATPEPEDLSRIKLASGEVLMVQNGSYYNESTITYSIGFSLLIVIICFGMMLGYGIFKMVDQPKSAIKPLIVFGGIVLVFVIGYAMQSGMFSDLNDDPKALARMGTTEVLDTDQKDAGGGIITALILVVSATVLAIGWSVVNLIKLNR